MNNTPEGPRRVLSGDELEARLTEIQKGQQLAGHYPDADALDRARRILEGKITLEQANEEILRKYRGYGSTGSADAS